MLPPADPAILQRNPNFEILYKDLCTRKINKDGETRDTRKQRVHDEIRKSLTTSLTTLTTTHLLLHTLSTLPSQSPSLPPTLHPLIDLITALLNNHIPPSSRPILTADIQSFLSNITTISSALSETLIRQTEHLCRIADPIHQVTIEGLCDKAKELDRQASVELPNELGERRVEVANMAYEVLDLHREVLECAIRVLERGMYGAGARSVRARAEGLGAKARAVGVKARLHTLTHPPPSAFLSALKSYKNSQGNTEAGLKDREALAKTALGLYEKAGEKTMRDLAKRAGYLRGEIGRVGEEVGTLERGG